MKKFAFAFAALALSAGCASYANSNPTIGVGGFDFEKWKKGTDYELVGDTQGQACKALLFGFITLEGEAKVGTLETVSVGQGGTSFADMLKGLFGGGPSATSAAKYNAIEAFKGADFILPTRSKSDKTDYLVYNRECVTITGKAVRVKL
ncbi:MAG: hypothetical protein KIT79_04570 [Deltaproteobacteria bacterium]|nr:hypothetical protein [Deltaproteobacteria bacterium]